MPELTGQMIWGFIFGWMLVTLLVIWLGFVLGYLIKVILNSIYSERVKFIAGSVKAMEGFVYDEPKKNG